MSIRLLVLVAAIAAPACQPDPACAPGQATLREADCMRRAVVECNVFEGPERQQCFENWDGICEAEASDYDARCTR